MQFSAAHEYPKPVDRVFAALTDFEAMRAKYVALGHSKVELIRRDVADDGAVTVVTRRVVPLDLPGFAKRVLSPRQTVTQTDTWSAPDAKGARTGTFAVEAKGTPVTVGGALGLTPRGAKACTFTVDVKVECKLPLIGGKLADFVGGDTRKAVDHEHTWMAAHLAGR